MASVSPLTKAPFGTPQWGFDIGDSPCWLYGSGGSAANGTAAGGGGGSSVAVLPAAAQNSSAYPEDPENNTVWYSQVPAWSGLAWSDWCFGIAGGMCCVCVCVGMCVCCVCAAV